MKNKLNEKRLVLLLREELRRERPVLAWTVRLILEYGRQKHSKDSATKIQSFILQGQVYHQSSTKTFILFRTQMLELLNYPKSTFDQLVIELPCLMGFRASEVCTWRAEYIDFQHMNTQVFDAKKKQLLTVSLDPQVAAHAEIVLHGRSKGIVLQSRSNRNKGQQITPIAVWCIWKKWGRLAGLPNAHEISPGTGRQFYAGYWYHFLKLGLVTLQINMRHSDPRITLNYVQKLVFFQDVQDDAAKFHEAIARDMADYKKFQMGMAKAQDKFRFALMQPKEAQ